MFKLDQKEFIAFRVDFQNALINHAHEIVGETMQKDGEFDGDWDELACDCIESIDQVADRECIYTADNYKTVQFMQQWFSEEVDDAEQQWQDCGFVFENLDTYMTQIAYFIWHGHLHAAVTNRIEELQEREAA